MLQYIYYRLEKVTPLVHGVKSYSTVYIYILPTGRNCAVKSYSMYVDGFSELQLYTPVKWKLYLFSSQYDKRNFFMSIINKKIALANWLSLKKIASAYQRQIALKIMLLPIQIDDMYNRKQIKRGGRRGVRLIYSIPLFMSFLSNFSRFSSGNYATGIARRQFLHYKKVFPLPTHKTSFFHWFSASVYLSWLCKDTQVSFLIHCNHNLILTFQQSENRVPTK